MPVWVWGWPRPLVFFRRCPDWMLPISNNLIWVCKLDLSRPDGCRFGFGGGSRPLVFFRQCPDWLLPILNNWIRVCKLDLSRPDGCQFGFGGGSRPLVLHASNLEQLDLGLQAGLVQTRRMPGWVWGWLEAFRFFRWCPDWTFPILNNDLVWAWKLVLGAEFLI